MKPPEVIRQPWVPYVAPMATFLLLTSLEGYLPRLDSAPHPTYYPIFYAAKVAVVAAVFWLCRSTWRDFAPRPGVGSIVLATATGLLVTFLWVGLDRYYPRWGEAGTRASFDPNAMPETWRYAFLGVRFFGLVLLVPAIEELFWRSFVIRWIIDPDDFRRVPIGRVTPLAAAATAGLFALEHPAEWLPALITGALWAWLLHWTRSVSACFISHAVANLGLGIYVLIMKDWKYW